MVFIPRPVMGRGFLCLKFIGEVHDFEDPSMQLITKPITIHRNAFVGVRAMVLPGVSIGENAIVGAQATVTKDVPANEIFAGSPAHKIGERKN